MRRRTSCLGALAAIGLTAASQSANSRVLSGMCQEIRRWTAAMSSCSGEGGTASTGQVACARQYRATEGCRALRSPHAPRPRRPAGPRGRSSQRSERGPVCPVRPESPSAPRALPGRRRCPPPGATGRPPPGGTRSAVRATADCGVRAHRREVTRPVPPAVLHRCAGPRPRPGAALSDCPACRSHAATTRRPPASSISSPLLAAPQVLTSWKAQGPRPSQCVGESLMPGQQTLTDP